MSIDLTQPAAFADLGGVWLDDQSARLRQRYLQFGRHYRVNADELLSRLATIARASRASQTPVAADRRAEVSIRRATVEAIEYCSWLENRARGAALAGTSR